ncbi:MAG: hypothetical protein IJR00_06835 [Lachnospiraceae bacterium]|nr:hypothetical protein [Lachnospiraceae bacterium]
MAVQALEPRVSGKNYTQDNLFATDVRAQQAAPAGKTGLQDAFRVDLKSAQVPGAASGRRGTELLQAQNPQEMTASRNMDVLLAHTLSPEDAKKAREDGYNPAEIEAGETVTMIDHIKASLLQSGVEVSGVTDDLDPAVLKEITGSEAYAQELLKAFSENDLPLTKDNVSAVQDAVSRASQLTAPDTDAILYLVENELPAGVDALYLAAHASKGFQGAGGGYFAEEGGYLAKAGEGGTSETLQKQIDEVITRSGLSPADEGIQKEAKTMLENGVALTPAHLGKAHSIGALTFPLERETVVKAAAAAIAAGKSAGEGDLTDPRGILEKAVEADRAVRAVTDADLAAAVMAQEDEGAELTLQDVTDAAATDRTPLRPAELYTGEAQQAPVDTTALSPAQEARFLESRLQMEEIRLSMSVSANLTMLRSGFSIDTAPLSALVDELRNAVEQNAKALFGGADAAAISRVSLTYQASASYTMTNAAAAYRLYAETNIKVEYLRSDMPVGVLGAVADEFKTDTLDDIFSRATTWKLANSAYETMQTEVRRDLGDSFEKAFGNADALLQDIGMEANKQNLRAVRILGYNRMEISVENVSRIRETDAMLDDILRDLKPAAVLDMIRDGKNPLRMSMEELAQELRGRTEKLSDSEDKYARFLYKLEQSGEITQAERSSYIGIYRMFETLQKTDHAAIGTLLNTGAEMTIANLLTATRTVRTAQGAGVELAADDGGVTKGRITNAIETQIESAFIYYRAEADRAYAHLAPEKLQQLADPESMALPAFAEAMEELPEDTAAERRLDEQQLNAMREALSGDAKSTAREDAAKALEAGDLPLTTHLIEAMRALAAGRSRGTKETLWEEGARLSEETEAGGEVREALEAMREFTSAEDETAAYRAGADRLQQSLQEIMADARTTYTQYMAAASLQRQVSTASLLAEQGSFEIPVEANGRTVSMQVTLTADSGQGSAVSITYDTGEFGTVAAQMRIEEQTVFASISTTYGRTPQVQSFMEQVVERLQTGISREEHLLSDISSQVILYNAKTSEAALPQRGEKSNTKQLLRLARVFTQAVMN